MRRKILIVVAVIFIGVTLTVVSASVNRTAPFDSCGGKLNQAKKGFPLPYILMKPSESLCEPVEPFSRIIKGNAFHEEYPINFVLDVIFWSGMSAVATLLVLKGTKR